MADEDQLGQVSEASEEAAIQAQPVESTQELDETEKTEEPTESDTNDNDHGGGEGEEFVPQIGVIPPTPDLEAPQQQNIIAEGADELNITQEQDNVEQQTEDDSMQQPNNISDIQHFGSEEGGLQADHEHYEEGEYNHHSSYIDGEDYHDDEDSRMTVGSDDLDDSGLLSATDGHHSRSLTSPSIEEVVEDFGRNIGEVAKEAVFKKELHRAATIIQSRWRGYQQRKKQRAISVEEEERAQRDRRAALLAIYAAALEERERLISTNLQLQRKLSFYFASTSKKSVSDPDEAKLVGTTVGGGGSGGVDDSRPSNSKRDQSDANSDADSRLMGDSESKYKKYLSQLREMAKELRLLRENNQATLDEMRRTLKEREDKAQEFIQSATQFRRASALSAENSRTGKPIPEKFVSHFEKLQSSKDAEVKEERIKYIELRNQKTSLDESISEKDEFSKGLHLIDFEQLKIENSTLNEKIEERNEDLMKLRKKATTTVHIVTHVKEKLQFVQIENQELKKALAELENELSKHKDVLSQIKRDRDTLKKENKKMTDNMPLVGSDALLLDYENRKEQIAALKRRRDQLKERYRELVAQINQFKMALRNGHGGTTATTTTATTATATSRRM